MKKANKDLDTICIRDLMISCIVGTKPSERVRRRRVVLNLELSCDLARAGATDDLRHTVDYADVCERVRKMVSRSHCQIIESLAQQIADVCLGVSGVRGVSVTLDKPGAVRGCRSVAVVMKRWKP
jgi:FolB domain-containing protein